MTKIIGSLKGNRVKLEYTGNGFVYKNEIEFNNKSNEICYIPEHGVDDGIIDEFSATYTYKDIYDMVKEYIDNNGLTDDCERLTKHLFNVLDWQDPSTMLIDWQNDL